MNDNEQGGLDRRALIKRAGIVSAGVAAWSSPTVTSLASRAYAAGSVPSSCKACDFTVCGHNANSIDGNCYCYPTDCTCGQNAFCVDLNACGPGNSCPPGYFCSTDNNCGTSLCVPTCDNTEGVSTGTGSGRTVVPT